jgi:cold shock CspA family protein
VTPGADETGIVEAYDPVLFYGFIRDRRGRRLFFHKNEVVQRKRLYPGDLVGFDVGPAPGTGRPEAQGVVTLHLVPRPVRRAAPARALGAAAAPPGPAE